MKSQKVAVRMGEIAEVNVILDTVHLFGNNYILL